MNERQKRFAAHVAQLRKRAATGDVIAKQELVRISEMAAKAARQVREKQVLGALAIAHQVNMQREAQDDAERAALYTPDRFDIADATADLAVSGDSLDKKVAARRAEWQQLDQMAPFMRTNPVSALNGTLGNQATLTIGGPDATEADARAQVVLWQGDDAETTPITVTLAPVAGVNAAPYRNSATVGVPPAYPYAIVQFGTRGFLANFEVDIGQGCQFTLTASTVSVEVALEQPAAPTANSVEAQLSAMLSFGPTNRQPAPITRTLRRSVTAGVTEAFIVPHYASRIALQLGDPAGTYLLTFLNSIADNISAISGTGSMLSAVDLPNGCYAVSVKNTGAGNFVTAVIFELGF